MTDDADLGEVSLRRLVRSAVRSLEAMEDRDVGGANFQESNRAVLLLLTKTLRKLAPHQKSNLVKSLHKQLQVKKTLTHKEIAGLVAGIAFWTFYLGNYPMTDPHTNLSKNARRIIRKDSQMEADRFFEALAGW